MLLCICGQSHFYQILFLTTLGDRMEMANSIEGRLPFLDHHLVDVVSKIPVSMKLKDGISKYILRQVAKPYLPERIYARKKHYFRAPPATITSGNKMSDFICDMLNSQNFKSLPSFVLIELRS